MRCKLKRLMKLALFGLCCLGVTSMGCAPRMIKGTTVPHSEKNKAVVQVVQQYRYRFMNKQWRKLLTLVSPRFYETGGKNDSTKHYGYATLRKKMLSPEMNKVRIIRFKIHIDEIKYPNPKEAHVFVRKAYTFLFPRGKYRPGLNSGTLRQKMVLEFDRGRWLFRRW